MALNSNIEKLIKNHITLAAYVLSEQGNVVTYNEAGKKYLPNIDPGLEFFKLFETDASEIVERLFLESKNFNKPVKEELALSSDDIKDEYDVVISPIDEEGENLFLLTIAKIEKKYSKSGTDKFTVHTSEIEELLKEPKLLSVIKKIKTSFPFTFIGKTKFQKEIDNLDEMFWLKETSGKYIIVNHKFAISLGMKSSQIEGQNEKELLPKYMVKLYSTIDSYILETTNSVFIDRVSEHTHYEKSTSTEIIEFPITDLDNKVVAIVGISRLKSYSPSGAGHSPINYNLIKQINKPVIIIDDNLKIIAYSESVKRFLIGDEKSNLVSVPIEHVVNKNILQTIVDYKEKLSSDSIEYEFETGNADRENKTIKVILNKMITPSDEIRGMSIEFEDKLANQSQLDIKGKMYDVIMQASPEAMFVYDVENLKFIEVNEAALKLYGYKRDIFLNMDLTDLYAPEDIQTLIESSDSKRLAGSFTGPWRHKKSDGSSILVELNKTDLDYNNRRAHLNIVRDVTEDIEKNKKYQLFQAIYENTNDIIINTDKDGFITLVNEAAVKLLERTKKDLEKRPFLSLVGDNDRAKINSEIFHSGEKNKQTVSIELKKESGDLIDADICATPIIDYMGEIESFNLIIQPEEEYDTSVENVPAETSGSSGGGIIDAPFLSNVFHELLTPINVIIGFVQELQESIAKPSEDQVEAIQIINENQKMLLQLMDNAVEYSQLEQQQITLRPSELLFTDIIDELKDNVKKTASANKVEFTYGKISSSLKFHTDQHRIMSLLTLFMKFAIQITKEKKVFLSAYLYDDSHCVISVKDKRSGITEYLSKGLTEIFTKDENQIRRNYGFSRFTVKLTQKLVQLLAGETEMIVKNGNVVEYGIVLPLEFEGKYEEKNEIETVVVKGEEIPIEKPVATVETVKKEVAPEPAAPTQSVQDINVSVNVAAPEKEEKPAAPAPEVVAPPPAPVPVPVPEPVAEVKPQPDPIPTIKKELDVKILSCLYVEDQVDSQILFKVQMKDLRSMEFALSFEEALPLIKSHRFDFIVLDINLQGEYNGLDALRVIQKLPGYEDTPVIAVTAYVLPGDREKFIAAGFTDFISKPVLRDKLIDVLKKIF